MLQYVPVVSCFIVGQLASYQYMYIIIFLLSLSGSHIQQVWLSSFEWDVARLGHIITSWRSLDYKLVL